MEEEKDILAEPLKKEEPDEKVFEKYKATLPKQFRSVFGAAALASVVMMIIGFFALIGFFKNESTTPGALEIISSVIMMLIYFMVIYTAAYNIGNHDKKPYSPLKPYKYKGLVLCIHVLSVTLILFIIYKIIWTVGGIDTVDHGIASEMLKAGGMNKFASWFDMNKPVRVLPGMPAIICNILYIIWTFPFYGLILPIEGHAGLTGVALSLLVPAAASFLGYIAGCKSFDLSYAMRNLVYEKNK